uniref:myosin-11-like n=1 Tax=Styela clava TaxID=7725 RepID=UPI001939B16D|nr:myosin-11-like [Styela clava]
MEMVKPKKKKTKKVVPSQENVPLHDILNTDSGAEEPSKSKQKPHGTDSPKQKKKKKNEVSPDIQSASVTTVEELIERPTSAGKQDAWQGQGDSTAMEAGPSQMPQKKKNKSKKKSSGVENPALSLADEAELPGSVPDLQDTTIDSMPAAFSPPVASSTILDDDDNEDENKVPSTDTTNENDAGNSRSRPTTPRSKNGSTPGTPASKFHRTLFGRPKSATKVAPADGKENASRPSTAPGYRVPFQTDFSPSPAQKRPATAAAHGARLSKSGRMDMPGSQRSLREKSFNTSTRSLKEGPEIESPKQAVAYVPYMHARNALTRVIDDMKSMKMNHLSIVAQIEEQYHGIENDSREQFNTFVISLQDEHKNKLNTFRQTIETHNVEIKDRNKYWAETLQSLSKRNKELLRQKRALLLAYQTDTQKLEAQLQAQKLGQVEELDSKSRIFESHIEDENKIEIDSKESEKKVHAVPVGAAVATGTIVYRRNLEDLVESHTQTDGDYVVGAFTVVDENESKWKERYEKEKEDNREQSEKMEREIQEIRALLASRGSSTQEERKVYEDKIKVLSKDLAKAKIEYETTYKFLQSIMAAIDSEEQFAKAMKKVEDDRAIMREEQERIEKEIKDWEEKWKKNHGGKLPDENEKPDAAKELDTQLAEVNQVLSDLDKQEQALIMLRKGQIPEASPDVPEPMVTTIEVRDPKLVAELETNKSQVKFLEEKLEKANDDLEKMSDLESDNIDLKDKIERYEKEMEAMRKIPIASTVALGAAVAASSDDQELQNELEEARTEIEELRNQLNIARLEGGGDFSGDMIGGANEDVEELMKKIEEHQSQIDELEKSLRNERETVEDLRAETGRIQSELDEARSNLQDNEDGVNAKVLAATAVLTASVKDKENEIKELNDKVEELEKARIQNMDIDSKTEIERAQKETKMAKTNSNKLKKEKEELGLELAANKQKMKSLDEKIAAFTVQETSYRAEIESTRKAKQKAVKDCETKFAEKERKRKLKMTLKISFLKTRFVVLKLLQQQEWLQEQLRKLQVHQLLIQIWKERCREWKPRLVFIVFYQALRSLTEFKRQKADDQNRIKDLDRELKEAKSAAKSTAGDKEKKAVEKKVKDLEKKLEMETKKFERELKRANELSDELEQLKKEFNDLEKKHKALLEECAQLSSAAEAGAEAAEKVMALENETKQLTAEVKTLTDNYNSERVLRKKYYNMVEDMKGKIRVYCRYRPMSKTEMGNNNKPVVRTPDEYTIQVDARGTMKEFQFDQIFTDESTQGQIFEDTFNLIQSAVDGFNVCIFAYGQTGSGKTYTMIGDGAQTQPGIAPRAFKRIFDLIDENKSKMKFEVSCYMLELYNDNLLDLLVGKGNDSGKMDIKKDKKGMVYVQGATVQKAANSDELYSIFEKGSSSRHVASTKMNAESSRSHLVIAIIMESVNLTTGAITRGKLSLVDLAGSERVGKTGASAQQLKEANSINKSLSALGDVISALSSEQSFIPYRNNKLTMLMQDSIGGNAKTLMFVNISPADYNADETAISLTYASRVKLITNDASKNAESREVARLKTIISKMKSGDSVEEDE